MELPSVIPHTSFVQVDQVTRSHMNDLGLQSCWDTKENTCSLWKHTTRVHPGKRKENSPFIGSQMIKNKSKSTHVDCNFIMFCTCVTFSCTKYTKKINENGLNKCTRYFCTRPPIQYYTAQTQPSKYVFKKSFEVE